MDTSKRYGANLVCQGIVGFVPTYATVWLFLPKFEIFIYAPISGQFGLGNLIIQGWPPFQQVHYEFITFCCKILIGLGEVVRLLQVVLGIERKGWCNKFAPSQQTRTNSLKVVQILRWLVLCGSFSIPIGENP